MTNKFKISVAAANAVRVEFVRAENHEDAAIKYLKRISRRDFGTRAYTPHVTREGITLSGANAWKGELWRRARDGNGWITNEYLFSFVTSNIAADSALRVSNKTGFGALGGDGETTPSRWPLGRGRTAAAA